MAETPVVQRIKSLSNGISKQAATVRYPNQVEDCNNVQFSVLNGAVRRPGSEHILDVSGDIAANRTYAMHLIERDDQERYMVVYGNGTLKVIDLSNNAEIPVDMVGTGLNYLGIGSAQSEDIRFLTIGDTTFICNTLVATGMIDDNAINPGVMPHRLTRVSTNPLQFRFGPIPWTERNFIEQLLTNETGSTSGFLVTFKGATTPSGIAGNAKASNFTEGDQGDGVDQRLEKIRTVGSGKVICTFGPLGTDPVLIEVSPDIQTGSAAPTVSADGGTINRAVGDMFSSNDSLKVFTRGSNDRNPAPDPIRNNQTIRDMAYYRGRLCLAFQDTLVFSRVDETFNFFIERPAAVSDSDPVIIQIASDDVASVDWVVPFQGSLLLLTKQGRQYFLEDVTVFSSSTAAVVASSRYETQSVKPVALGNNLYLVGASAQFTPVFQYFFDDLSSSNRAVDVSKHVQGLLPKKMQSMTGSVSSNTLAAVAKVDIIPEAQRFFEADADGDWGDYTIWEKSDTLAGTYTDIASSVLPPQPYDHVIIPAGITVTLDPTFANTDECGYPIAQILDAESAEIYTYRWYDVGNERQQSAWGRWTYGLTNLTDAKVLDDELYILRRTDFSTGSKLSIDKISLADNLPPADGFARHAHIDFQYSCAVSNDSTKTQATFNSAGAITFWTLRLNGTATVNDLVNVIVLSSDYKDVNGNSLEGTEVNVTANSQGVVTATAAANTHLPTLYVNGIAQDPGNYRQGRTLLGFKYQSDVTLSRVYARVGEDIPMVEGRTQIDQLIVDHQESGSYQIQVIPKDTAQAGFTHDVTNETVDTGSSEVSVGANAATTTMKLIATTPVGVKWNSYEVHGRHSTNRR